MFLVKIRLWSVWSIAIIASALSCETVVTSFFARDFNVVERAELLSCLT